MDQVSDSCDSHDLTISIKTTEVVYQSAPEKSYKEPEIKIKGERLQVLTNSPTLEAHCLELCTLMMKSIS